MAAIHPATRYPSTRYAESLRIGAPRLLADIVGISSIAFDLDPTPRTINGTPTAYQEFGGITTADTHGQPVGLLLDTKNTSLWGSIIPVANMNEWVSGDQSGWTFNATSASYVGDGSSSGPTVGFYYAEYVGIPIEIEYTISHYSGPAQSSGMNNYSLALYPSSATKIPTISTGGNGTYTFRGYWYAPSYTAVLWLIGGSNNSFTMSRPVIRRIDGNHGTQTTSGARPALQYVQDNRPGWALKFDLFDDALVLYSVTPAGAGCTVYIAGLTSVTRVDNVTIGNQYTLTGYQYVRRVIALTRAPTASEDARIRKYLYELYGVL